MSYKKIEISERIEKLKESYKSLPVPSAEDIYAEGKYKIFCTGDRWLTLSYLRGWRDSGDAATLKLRASLAEAAELDAAVPLILDDELLLGHLSLPEYTDAEWEEYGRLCEAFEMSPYHHTQKLPRKDHIALDYEKLIKVGINGVREEIRQRAEAINLADRELYPDTDALSRLEFYECLLTELDAVSRLARRYATAARELAQRSPSPRREELFEMAEIISRVPDEGAKSFREAVQSVHFFLSTLFGLYPLARPDRYLIELYEKDIKSGALTRELAQELVDNFCLGVSDRVFSRAACGFIVGGEGEDGVTVENELTYMFLTSLAHLKLPDPNGALAVNESTSDELLSYAAEILSDGTTHPAFFNDRVIIDSLVKNYGCERRDAVNYIHATCAEISIAGKSKAHTTPMIVTLPELLSDAAAECKKYNKMEDLLEIFLKKIKQKLIAKAKHYFMRLMEAGRYGNDSMRAYAFVDDCIARGRSVYEGGERYTLIEPIFIGFGNTVDSLCAIDTLVGREKRFTLPELSEIVRGDFAGHEDLRQYIINKLPHYGNDDTWVDSVARQLYESISAILRSTDMPGRKYMIPGTFSYVLHANAGASMPATFDGRAAHTSLSDGCCAVQGRDVNGPTAMIKSLTSFDQSEYLGGMVVNVKFGSATLKGEGISRFISLLRAFIKRGGIEMQVNSVDRATLLDAKENPDSHRDLIVRIGGYSDYFTRLSLPLQNEIIERTEY